MDLILRNLPETTHDHELNLLNICACLFNVILPAILWVLFARVKNKAGFILNCILQLSLVASCTALSWGLYKMVKIVGSVVYDMLPKKRIIIMYLAAYLFIILVNVATLPLYLKESIQTYKVSIIIGMVVYSACNIIFGLIVNTIVSKIEIASRFSETDRQFFELFNQEAE